MNWDRLRASQNGGWHRWIGCPIEPEKMKMVKAAVSLLALLFVGCVAGCSGTSAKSPDVSDSIRASLDQTGLKEVSITQDRDKGVVTLGGHVATDGDKLRAETVAKSLSGGQVVADQIAVVSSRR